MENQRQDEENVVVCMGLDLRFPLFEAASPIQYPVYYSVIGKCVWKEPYKTRVGRIWSMGWI